MKFPLHHIGIVVKDIDSYLEKRLSGTISVDLEDPVQEARIVLLEHDADHPTTELIQPLTDTATTAGALKRNGGGYHHLCYRADNVQEVEDYFQQEHIKRIYGPVDAPALQDCPVIFGYTPNREIIEFVVQHG